MVIQGLEQAIRERYTAKREIGCKINGVPPPPPHALLFGTGENGYVCYDMMRGADKQQILVRIVLSLRIGSHMMDLKWASTIPVGTEAADARGALDDGFDDILGNLGALKVLLDLDDLRSRIIS
jgi:hypothetical protein